MTPPPKCAEFPSMMLPRNCTDSRLKRWLKAPRRRVTLMFGRVPAALYLAFNAVHTPMDATDKYLARVKDVADPQRRTYLAMLAGLDDAVGQVLAKVKEAKLEEQTLIVFISDNGGPIDKYAVNGSRDGPAAYATSSGWSETGISGITWATRPVMLLQ